MNKNLIRILVTVGGLLMFVSIGAGANLNVNNSSVHASRISRLRGQMNSDYKKANYYGRQAKRIKQEIAKLSRTSKQHHGISSKAAYRIGYHDGYRELHGASSRIFHYNLRNNKSYYKGRIDAVYYAIVTGKGDAEKQSPRKARQEARLNYKMIEERSAPVPNN